MTLPAFYLETSVWGSLARRQPRDRKQVVYRLLRFLDGVRGTCVISDVVIAEIQDADPEDVARIQVQLAKTHHTVYAITPEMEALASAYIKAGVLPEGREADAMHVAAATCQLEPPSYDTADETDTIRVGKPTTRLPENSIDL